MSRRKVLAAVGLLCLSGCAPVTPSPMPADTPRPSPAITSTPAPTPSPEPSLRPTRTPLPPPPWCPIDDPPQASEGTIRMAYVSSDHDLYLQDGSAEPRRLTESGDVTRALISTDGARIAYVRDPEGFPPELWVVHADGTNAHRILGKPAVESLNPELTTQPEDYSFMYRWIPYHHELIVEARAVVPDGWDWVTSGVQRLDVDRLALRPFPGPWESPFSPDGEWFAMPEDDSLTLIRTDGTEEYHRVLDGYRFIGISSYSILPPLAWTPNGVRVIFPPHDYADGLDPREPPFEVWDVPFGGDPVHVDTISDRATHSDIHYSLNLAPNGRYYAHSDRLNRIYITEIAGGTYTIDYQWPGLGFSWWNAESTHFLHQATRLALTDICGNTTNFGEDTGQVPFQINPKWLDAARVFIVSHHFDAEGHHTGIDAYLLSARDLSLSLIGEGWLDADAVLIP